MGLYELYLMHSKVLTDLKIDVIIRLLVAKKVPYTVIIAFSLTELVYPG